ncbi:hypothetical protein FQA39_LY00685 [Lamprigera yunnana]|nr:hypothetical protein FQA39_LY00685 [Lamprigera yunnana]
MINTEAKDENKKYDFRSAGGAESEPVSQVAFPSDGAKRSKTKSDVMGVSAEQLKAKASKYLETAKDHKCLTLAKGHGLEIDFVVGFGFRCRILLLWVLEAFVGMWNDLKVNRYITIILHSKYKNQNGIPPLPTSVRELYLPQEYQQILINSVNEVFLVYDSEDEYEPRRILLFSTPKNFNFMVSSGK